MSLPEHELHNGLPDAHGHGSKKPAFSTDGGASREPSELCVRRMFGTSIGSCGLGGSIEVPWVLFEMLGGFISRNDHGSGMVHLDPHEKDPEAQKPSPR